MPDHAERIEQLRACLSQALQPTHLEILDDSRKHAGHAGARGGGHFSVTIVSPRFAGKNPLERHRMVYAAVGELLNAQVHALSIRTYAPAEYSA